MNKSFIFALAFILIFLPKTTKVDAAPLSAHTTSSQSEAKEMTVTHIEQLLRNEVPSLAFVEVGTSRDHLKALESAKKAEPASVKQLAKQLAVSRFGNDQFGALDAIITRESNWNVNAINKSSGACGLGQAYPCSKMKDRSPRGQVEWVINYIANRYGTPTQAWHFWQANGWY